MISMKACFTDSESNTFFKNLHVEEIPARIDMTEFRKKFKDGSYKVGSVVPKKTEYYLVVRTGGAKRGCRHYRVAGHSILECIDEIYDAAPLELYK